jgi:low affinity Fe/Cu permease
MAAAASTTCRSSGCGQSTRKHRAKLVAQSAPQHGIIIGKSHIGAKLDMSRATKDQNSRPDFGFSLQRMFSDIANFIAHVVGRPIAFSLAMLTVMVWAATGPVFGYSDTWQLVINTGTTIVTFLMVFLIQNSQNRDSAAVQVKLDELIRVSEVKNLFVGIEHLTDEEIEELREKCEKRARADAGDVVKKIGRKAQKAADAAG